ncbi:hypothetical protein ABKV19_007849 [Rosa sericea]
MNKYLGPVSSPNCNTSQLNLIYLWFESQSSQPFFYWLNVGDGKETNLEICLRTVLQSQCIKYLGPGHLTTALYCYKFLNRIK